MRKKISILLGIFYFFGFNCLKGQTTLTGKVFNTHNHPVENVIVYVDGGSAFSETDSNGYFEFKMIDFAENRNLVFKRVGYETKEVKISDIEKNSTLQILIIPKSELNQINVGEKRSHLLNQQLKLITERLIGTSQFSKECSIENLEEITLTSNNNNSFNFYSRNPIIIKNLALGYVYEFEINNSLIEGKRSGLKITSLLVKELTPNSKKTEKKWIENRNHTYYSSKNYFFNQISKGISDKKFQTFYVQNNINFQYNTSIDEQITIGNLVPLMVDTLKVTQIENDKFSVDFKKPVLVFFIKQYLAYTDFIFQNNKNQYFIFSQIGTETIFDNFGNVFSNYLYKKDDNVINGYFSHLLPIDFEIN